MSELHLIHIELPPQPGTRLVFLVPDDGGLFTASPVLLGVPGYTLDIGGDIWRAAVVSMSAQPSNPPDRRTEVAVEITGRYDADAETEPLPVTAGR